MPVNKGSSSASNHNFPILIFDFRLTFFAQLCAKGRARRLLLVLINLKMRVRAMNLFRAAICRVFGFSDRTSAAAFKRKRLPSLAGRKKWLALAAALPVALTPAANAQQRVIVNPSFEQLSPGGTQVFQGQQPLPACLLYTSPSPRD